MTGEHRIIQASECLQLLLNLFDRLKKSPGRREKTVERVGIQNRFGQVGPLDFLMKQYSLTAEDIAAAALRAIARRNG